MVQNHLSRSICYPPPLCTFQFALPLFTQTKIIDLGHRQASPSAQTLSQRPLTPSPPSRNLQSSRGSQRHCLPSPFFCPHTGTPLRPATDRGRRHRAMQRPPSADAPRIYLQALQSLIACHHRPQPPYSSCSCTSGHYHLPSSHPFYVHLSP